MGSLGYWQGCQQAGPLSDADVQALRDLDDQQAKAINAGDWAKVASLYATDAVLMESNMPVVNGRDKIQALYAPLGKTREVTITPQQIEGRGDLAYIRGMSMTKGTRNGSAFSVQGKYIEIYKKQPDGKWAMIQDISNADEPWPPPAEPSKAPALGKKAAKRPATGKTPKR